MPRCSTTDKTQRAYNKSQGCREKWRPNWNKAVIECTMLMTKTDSELPNGNLDIAFHEAAVKMDLKRLLCILQNSSKEVLNVRLLLLDKCICEHFQLHGMHSFEGLVPNVICTTHFFNMPMHCTASAVITWNFSGSCILIVQVGVFKPSVMLRTASTISPLPKLSRAQLPTVTKSSKKNHLRSTLLPQHCALKIATMHH